MRQRTHSMKGMGIFTAAAFGTSCAELADLFDHLVAMSVTDFGTRGPRAGWQATDSVLYALSTVLSRSGPPGGAPVLPPDGIASTTAAAQAAWAALVAYYQRLRCGRGDYIDFSRYDAVLQALDRERLRMWRNRDGEGQYLNRRLHFYFIWNPEVHHESPDFESGLS